MNSTEGLFHCDNCNESYDLDKIEIYGIKKGNKNYVYCEKCYVNYKGGKPNGNVI